MTGGASVSIEIKCNGCGYVFLSKCYPMCFIHSSAFLSTAEKALYNFYITLHYKVSAPMNIHY